MKPVKFLQVITLLLTLCSCDSCKEDLDTLPPETQTGANTFGCLIDEELFIGGCCAPWMTPVIGGEYHTISDELYAGAWGKMNGNPAGNIVIVINHPAQNNLQTIEKMVYQPRSGCIQYLALNKAEVFITKFDTIHKIVSGSFQFVGYCGDDSTSTNTKQITQGRFDLKFDIYNE